MKKIIILTMIIVLLSIGTVRGDDYTKIIMPTFDATSYCGINTTTSCGGTNNQDIYAATTMYTGNNYRLAILLNISNFPNLPSFLTTNITISSVKLNITSVQHYGNANISTYHIYNPTQVATAKWDDNTFNSSNDPCMATYGYMWNTTEVKNSINCSTIPDSKIEINSTGSYLFDVTSSFISDYNSGYKNYSLYLAVSSPQDFNNNYGERFSSSTGASSPSLIITYDIVPIYTRAANITISAYDENSQIPIPFDADIYYNSTYLNSVTAYRSYPLPNPSNCLWDKDEATPCASAPWTNSTIQAFGKNDALFLITWRTDGTGTLNVTINNTLIYNTTKSNGLHHEYIQINNSNYEWKTKTVNITVSIASISDNVRLYEIRMLANTANYNYIDNNTIEVINPFNSTAKIYVSGDITYASTYSTTPRMYVVASNTQASTTLKAYLIPLNGINGIRNVDVLNTLTGFIEGATVSVMKLYGNTFMPVDQRVTAIDGRGTFFVNPTSVYLLKAEHPDYQTAQRDWQPSTDTSISLTSGATSKNFTGLYDDITLELIPEQTVLPPGSSQDFNWTVSAFRGDLEFYGMNITKYDGSHVDTTSTSPTGGIITTTLTMLPNNTIVYVFFKKINYTLWSGNRTYYVYNISSANTTIVTIMTNLSNSASGLDNTARAIIAIFITMIIMAGAAKFTYTGAGFVGLIVMGIFIYSNWFVIMINGTNQAWGVFTLMAIGVFGLMYLRSGI